jgi:hypothetical protein
MAVLAEEIEFANAISGVDDGIAEDDRCVMPNV